MKITRSLSNGAVAGALFLLVAHVPGSAQQRPRAVVRPRNVAPRAAQHATPRFVPNRYIVFLADPPVAARYSLRTEMQSSTAAAYRRQVQTNQQSVMRDMATRNIRVTGTVDTLLNAVFVVATPDRLAEIRGLSGVIGVMPERAMKKSLNKATALANAPAAWAVVGGQSNAGKGIKIGILDTGIDQNHPAFVDPSLSMPAGFPKCNNPSDCTNFTNSKVIVARSYVPQIAAQVTCASPTLAGCKLATNPVANAATSTPDDYSARDRDGHGTSVASAAAANQNSGGSIAFSGMAPKAYLGSYKIWGTPGVNDFPPESVWIQALEDALNDGMDVVNMSSGGAAVTGALDTTACGNPAGVPCDPLATAFEAAAKAGLVITVAAGNGGEDAYNNGENYPTFNSISSPGTAPSVIAVGGTLNSHALGSLVSVQSASAPANLKAISAQRSDSFFGYDPLTGGCCASPGLAAPLVDVTKLGDNGMACSALPAGSLGGKFALIQRGGGTTCTFDVKTMNAQNAGAAGVIIYNNVATAPIPPEGVNISGPAVMISQADGQALLSYLGANPGATVLIDTAGQEQSLSAFNQLASFSSFGPTPDGMIKPDLVATAGYDGYLGSADSTDPYLPAPNGLYVAAQQYDQNGFGYSATGYTAVDGTSLSAPLVAGAAALVKQAHPSWTAGQIKSALLNYSAQDVTTDDFGDPVDVEWMGAGRLDANAAVGATVSAEPATLSFGYLKSGVALPAPIAVKVTNLGSASVTLAVAVAPGGPVTGTTVTVSSPTITLAAGANTTLTVTLSGTVPKAGEYSGGITLKSSTPAVSMRIPYMFIVGDGVPFNAIPLFGCCYGAVNADLGGIPVQVVDQYGVPVAGAPVAWTVNPRGAVTLKSVAGVAGNTGNNIQPYTPAGCSPTSSGTGVTCPTDNYGVAWVEVVAGSATTSTATICATVGSYSCTAGTGLQFGVTLIPTPVLQPASAGGSPVEDSGAYSSTVAPGSYASIFGVNLMDPSFLFNSSGDVNSYYRMALTLDGVTVSFDAPATGTLPAISVPGHMAFVSPAQVNVFVPSELENYPSAQVKVTFVEYINSNVVNLTLANYVPAFLMNSGTVADAVDNNTGAIITTSNPAVAGEILQLYANGLGPVSNPPASGDPACGGGVVIASCTASSPFSQIPTPVIVTIGGKQITPIFSGLAPGYVGLYLLDITVPSGLTPGNQPITITVGGKTSPATVGGQTVFLPTK